MNGSSDYNINCCRVPIDLFHFPYFLFHITKYDYFLNDREIIKKHLKISLLHYVHILLSLSLSLRHTPYYYRRIICNLVLLYSIISLVCQVLWQAGFSCFMVYLIRNKVWVCGMYFTASFTFLNFFCYYPLFLIWVLVILFRVLTTFGPSDFLVASFYSFIFVFLSISSIVHLYQEFVRLIIPWTGLFDRWQVHGAFAGYSGITVGICNTHYVYLPIPEVISYPRILDPNSRMWHRCLTSTGQPDFF